MLAEEHLLVNLPLRRRHRPARCHGWRMGIVDTRVQNTFRRQWDACHCCGRLADLRLGRHHQPVSLKGPMDGAAAAARLFFAALSAACQDRSAAMCGRMSDAWAPLHCRKALGTLHRGTEKHHAWEQTWQHTHAQSNGYRQHMMYAPNYTLNTKHALLSQAEAQRQPNMFVDNRRPKTT